MVASVRLKGTNHGSVETSDEMGSQCRLPGASPASASSMTDAEMSQQRACVACVGSARLRVAVRTVSIPSR